MKTNTSAALLHHKKIIGEGGTLWASMTEKKIKTHLDVIGAREYALQAGCSSDQHSLMKLKVGL